MTTKDQLTYFKELELSDLEYSLPSEFTFPFYYEPHPIALKAAQELQVYLSAHAHNMTQYGLGLRDKAGYGKMFGVLVVQNSEGAVGYLSAYSGEIFEREDHSIFVPPIYDKFAPDSYFLKESEYLNILNAKIEKLESDPAYLALQDKLKESEESRLLKLEKQKQVQSERQRLRKKEREECLKNGDNLLYKKIHSRHQQESINDKFLIKEYNVYLKENSSLIQEKLDVIQNQIDGYKLERKRESIVLQNWLFDQYNFLNIQKDAQNVRSIFKAFDITVPPSGAGDCAAPKLLQYAFQNDLKPIAMAEFWWGTSPSTQVRRQGYFYPACRSKCEPILAHMLSGMEVAPNPITSEDENVVSIDIIFEDDHIAIINKPTEFLSVPGKHKYDSVYARMQEKYPKASGPMIVHRLDMSTSGIMIIAKTKYAHQELQSQFVNRTIKKTYVAVLEGPIENDSGQIELPLRVDLDNRPCQMVCYDHGKQAITNWEVIDRSESRARIRFYPITGRTHQLRVHAAHHLGLNAPIVGDDLYGKRGERLHLHAEMIRFEHPVSRKQVEFRVGVAF